MSAVSVDNLVVEVLLERGLKPEDVDILIGIDDGQGILKVSIVMIDKTQIIRKEDRTIQREFYQRSLKIPPSRNFTLYQLFQMFLKGMKT